jgi:hypothetical protein
MLATPFSGLSKMDNRVPNSPIARVAEEFITADTFFCISSFLAKLTSWWLPSVDVRQRERAAVLWGPSER